MIGAGDIVWAAMGSYVLCLGLALMLGEEGELCVGSGGYAVGLVDGLHVTGAGYGDAVGDWG